MPQGPNLQKCSGSYPGSVCTGMPVPPHNKESKVEVLLLELEVHVVEARLVNRD